MLLELLLLAIAAAFYPALLAVVIIFLGRPHPKKLLAFFLAGAWLTSLSIGLVAVFALEEPASARRRKFQWALGSTWGSASLPSSSVRTSFGPSRSRRKRRRTPARR